MYRILIADDEAVELRALEMMIRNDFEDCQLVPSAANGLELIARVEKYKPDVAIVDINMPGMNGLDALEMVRSKNKEMRILISSAYSEFQFARRAMMLGASDYILKPLNRESFQKALGEVLKNLETQRRKACRERNAQEQIHEMNTVVGNEFLSSILLGEPDEVSFRLMLRSLGQDYHGCILVSGRELQGEQALKKERLLKTEERITRGMNQFCRCVGKVHKEELCFLVFPGRASGETERERFRTSVLEVLNRAAVREEMPLVFGVSSWQEEPDGMTTGLEESRIAAQSQGKPGAYFYQRRDQKAGRRCRLKLDLGELLGMKERKKEDFLEKIRMFLARTQEEDYFAVRMAVFEALFPVYEASLEQKDYISRYRKEEQMDFHGMMECGNRAELEGWLEKTAVLLETSREEPGKKSKEYIQRTILYMEQHYREDLSLEQTAGASGISPFYLSRLLKQELHSTFVEILTAIRMRRALKLLCEKKYTVREISEQCGYGNIPYFYRVFKKYLGMSVGEVREYLE